MTAYQEVLERLDRLERDRGLVQRKIDAAHKVALDEAQSTNVQHIAASTSWREKAESALAAANDAVAGVGSPGTNVRRSLHLEESQSVLSGPVSERASAALKLLQTEQTRLSNSVLMLQRFGAESTLRDAASKRKGRQLRRGGIALVLLVIAAFVGSRMLKKDEITVAQLPSSFSACELVSSEVVKLITGAEAVGVAATEPATGEHKCTWDGPRSFNVGVFGVAKESDGRLANENWQKICQDQGGSVSPTSPNGFLKSKDFVCRTPGTSQQEARVTAYIAKGSLWVSGGVDLDENADQGTAMRTALTLYDEIRKRIV